MTSEGNVPVESCKPVMQAEIAFVQADVFYVPAAARLDFALAAGALAKSGLHFEIIMAVLLGIITEEDGQVDIMQVPTLKLCSCSFNHQLPAWISVRPLGKA